MKIENLYLTFVVQQQQDRMSEYNEEKQQMADLLSALFKTLAGNSTSGTEKCFTCGERMDEEEVEDNNDWCEKCRKKNEWRCFECDEIQKNRKYCEDSYGKSVCKDCRKGLRKDDYHFF